MKIKEIAQLLQGVDRPALIQVGEGETGLCLRVGPEDALAGEILAWLLERCADDPKLTWEAALDGLDSARWWIMFLTAQRESGDQGAEPG